MPVHVQLVNALRCACTSPSVDDGGKYAPITLEEFDTALQLEMTMHNEVPYVLTTPLPEQ